MYWYVIMPVIAWFVAGSVKFAVNYCRFGGQAVGLIGNGGFPSTHTTIVCSTVTLIALREGLNSPTTGLGVAFLMVTVFDALGLRRAVGRQAERINTLNGRLGSEENNLRERQGHTPVEVLGGAVLGGALAGAAFLLNSGVGGTP